LFLPADIQAIKKKDIDHFSFFTETAQFFPENAIPTAFTQVMFSSSKIVSA